MRNPDNAAAEKDLAQREFYKRLSALVWDVHRVLRYEISQRYPALIPVRPMTTAYHPEWEEDGWDYSKTPQRPRRPPPTEVGLP